MTIGRLIAPVSASMPFPPCTALVANEVSNGCESSGTEGALPTMGDSMPERRDPAGRPVRSLSWWSSSVRG
jgi:hypothetical protein